MFDEGWTGMILHEHLIIKYSGKANQLASLFWSEGDDIVWFKMSKGGPKGVSHLWCAIK